MTSGDRITAAEATELLGYKHRSSLTRLVQKKKLKPIFVASGARGEQFFKRSDVVAYRKTLPAPSSPDVDGSDPTTPADVPPASAGVSSSSAA